MGIDEDVLRDKYKPKNFVELKAGIKLFWKTLTSSVHSRCTMSRKYCPTSLKMVATPGIDCVFYCIYTILIVFEPSMFSILILYLNLLFYLRYFINPELQFIVTYVLSVCIVNTFEIQIH